MEYCTVYKLNVSLQYQNNIKHLKNRIMKTFNKLNVASKIKVNEKIVIIYKVQKEGTKRTFFSPEFEGKKITTTMFARLYDAEKLAKQYLNQAGL